MCSLSQVTFSLYTKCVYQNPSSNGVLQSHKHINQQSMLGKILKLKATEPSEPASERERVAAVMEAK